MKIVMLEPIAVSEELLNNLAKPIRDAGHEVSLCLAPLSAEEKAEKAKAADALIIANSPLSGQLLESLPSVKFISVAFTGIDHVPVEVCRRKGIVVSNSQGYATAATAELTIGLILACMRNLVLCDASARTGKTKDGLVGNELYGKTIGIIGYGAIGSHVAKVAKALGCKVLANSRSKKPGETDDGVVFCNLETLLKESDIVSLHTPLTPETNRMINADKLAMMKPSAILINAARGPIVDTNALADALNNGVIAGAGLDVFDIEPPLSADNPLLAAKNTVVAPHVGFATKESMVKRAVIVFDNVTAWLDGKPVNVKV